MEDLDVVVIGGGASGMMAAGRAAERSKKVLLLEKNPELGAKLKITGGGRCNITNAEYDEHVLLSYFGKAKDFLHSPFSKFGVKETFSFFASKGLPLKVEARKRAFPESESARDVVQVLEKYMRSHGAEVRTRAVVQGFELEGGKIKGVKVNGKMISARSYILATGGKSHPETGSTGDGFGWLSKLGLKVKEPTPTVVPVAVKERWVKQLAGTTLSDVRAIVFSEGKKKLVLKGNILCTHFGLSGPTILNSAGKIADLLHEGEVTLGVDVYPGEDIGSLDKRIVSVFDANKNKSLKNIWNEIAPLGTWSAISPLLKGVPLDIKVNSISKEQRRKIVDLLKALPVTVTGLMGYSRAVVADGGLLLEEVDTRTMRSKKFSNLYVTGDLLHINRPSGGYSLQLCWTTGFVAGSNV